MTKDKLSHLKGGALLYRVEEGPEDVTDLRVCEYTFTAKRLTELQLREPRATIPLQNHRRRVVRVSYVELINNFELTAVLAVHNYGIAKEAEVQRKRDAFVRLCNDCERIQKWVQDWQPGKVS